LFEGPLEQEDAKASNELVLSNLKRSLMADGVTFVHPHLLQPNPQSYSTRKGEPKQHDYFPWLQIILELIEGFDNVFCFHSFLVEESSDD
jgi:hypothetical protein